MTFNTPKNWVASNVIILKQIENIKMSSQCSTSLVNPFMANVPILYPLKTPQNQKFFGVFRGFKLEHWPEIG